MQLTIDSPAYGGFFIGRHEGKVVMIKGAVIPGEKAEVSIEEEKKDYIAASVKRIIEPSPHRIKPACDYFGTCGGCHLQYISYEKQVQLKEDILRDCLRRLAKIDPVLSESIIDNNPWNYRFRGQFKTSRGKIGFYREKTREVIDIDTCPLMADSVNNCLGKSRQLLKEPEFTELHITSGDSCIALLRSRADGISIKGVDKIKKLPFLILFRIYVKPGDTIKKIENHTERAGVFTVVGETRTEAFERSKKIINSLMFTMN